MKKHISFPSIEQFKNVIANVNRKHNFVGLDENGDAIYDPSKPKPKLKFKGTVKLHGCFEKDTLVTLANGEQTPISDINVGDIVLSYDFENNKVIEKEVTHTENGSSIKNGLNYYLIMVLVLNVLVTIKYIRQTEVGLKQKTYCQMMNLLRITKFKVRFMNTYIFIINVVKNDFKNLV